MGPSPAGPPTRYRGPVENPRYAASITVHARPEVVYDLVADVTRMGEWSPVCKACWWEGGEPGAVGSWFTGRNVTPERTWETRSVVVAAERGREFTFVVGGSRTRWSYTFRSVPEGTELTETWEFLPDGQAYFRERFGDDAPAQVADRQEAARRGIHATLEALKRAAEAAGGAGPAEVG